jgi:AcrR family transcriptional regulator
VRAAIELLDAEGPAGLSMRRLGTSLGAGATSLYWHVANKAELLELVVDEVMGEIYVPEAGDTHWRIAASVSAHGMRTMLLRHPWMTGLLGSKPAIGPNSMRNGERLVALFTAAGFTGMTLSHVSSVLNAHAIGSATMQTAVAAGVRQSGVGVEELMEKVEPYLERIAADHPHYDKWRRENLVACELDVDRLYEENFAFGLERILDGLEMWLSRQAAPSPDRSPAATAETG